jgi:hypothetical protein
MKIIEEYTFFNSVTDQEQTQKRIVTIGPDGQRLDEQDFNGCTAEQWLGIEGYTAIRLVTLLDLEGKLAAAGKTSPKLAAVRLWMNGVLATYVTDPNPKSDWTPAPFGFEETSAEAFAALTT